MRPAEASAGTGVGPVRRWSATVAAVLARVVETVAAALVSVEIVILLIGVIARFVLQAPLVWSDELSSALFLWLTMLGAVIASRRAVHMRMTAVVSAVPAGPKTFLDAVATVAGAAFMLFTLNPGFEYASDQAFITSPALSIPDVWRAAALPVGAALMLAFALLHLLDTTRLAVMLGAVALVAAVGTSLWLAAPLLRPLENVNLLLFFVFGVGAMVLAGVPIAFCFGLSTFGFLALTTRFPLTVVIGRMDGGMSQLILLAVPLFVFLGMLLEMTGMAQAMVRFLANLLGHVRGGLSYVLVGAMCLVSGVSGAKAADMAAVAPVLFPEMRRRGSRPGDLVALLAATGAQTETVPPSLVLITVGSVTGVSIGALFTGLAVAMGSLPGGHTTFLAVSVLAFAVLGSVLEGIPAMVLFGPLLFPIARQMGINEVHYAMVVVLAMGVGLFAPPFSVGYYAAYAISQVSPDAGMRPIWGYLLALMVGLTIVAAVPWLSTGFL